MGQSVMSSSHSFSQVPSAEIQRSSFDRSHGFKTTFDSGYLVPIFCDEVLPGDTFNLRMSAFARLATPIKPFMDNLFFDTFFFFVPNRLIWSHWVNFNGEKTNPSDSTVYTIPTFLSPDGGFAVGSVYDYFGLPVDPMLGANHVRVNALPLRAYNLIWNSWFRDENLQNSVTVNTGDSGDSVTTFALLKRGKRHDYFTSCLPWPQKGTAVALPLSGNAPIISSGVPLKLKGATSGLSSDMTYFSSFTGFGPVGAAWTNAEGVKFDNAGLTADLSAVTASTINQLREAFQLQRLLERDARGGTRYTEIVRSHFGVVSPDARLQRPEYLGGGSTPINVNPIAQTQATGASGTTSPQGNLAAMGTLKASGHGFVKSFTEHGYIIGMCMVRADLTYQQGVNRMWWRSTRYDFYWPALSHIGEQAVLAREIYCDGSSTDDDVFGYQERYAEYRYKPSLITGKFRSVVTTPLDYWHLSQKFVSLPALNAAFIEESPPIARVIAVPTEPQFLLDTYFSLRCARPMPVYGVPGLIDHF
ncbi:MAG: major capsid protein [Arizlama microvirus]|nr:MAG: major capsid protein [Arizlama microvirus]